MTLEEKIIQTINWSSIGDIVLDKDLISKVASDIAKLAIKELDETKLMATNMNTNKLYKQLEWKLANQKVVAEGIVNADSGTFNGEEWCYVINKDGEYINITELLQRFMGKKVIIRLEVEEELPKFKDIIGLFKDKESE